MPDAATAVLTKPPAAPAASPADFRTARIIALVAGLLGALFAIATPFLPVTQTTAVLNWPQSGTAGGAADGVGKPSSMLGNVQAPLMSQVPIDLKATIPCSTVAQLPERGGMLLATAPPQGDRAALEALFIRVSETSVDVIDRNAVVVSAPRADMEQCSSLVLTSDHDRTRAVFEGLTTTVTLSL
ncbi:hypothetical protein ACWIG5_40050, partial [Streptomyces lydicus]